MSEKAVVSSKTLEEQVFEIVKKKFSDKEVTLKSTFKEDLGADSLDLVELIMDFETSFNLQIPDEDAEKVTTVGYVVDYIRRKQGGAAEGEPSGAAGGEKAEEQEGSRS